MVVNSYDSVSTSPGNLSTTIEEGACLIISSSDIILSSSLASTYSFASIESITDKSLDFSRFSEEVG